MPTWMHFCRHNPLQKASTPRPDYHSANALEVAVAAAYKLDIVHLAILDIKENGAGTGSLGFVFVMHNVSSFLFIR